MNIDSPTINKNSASEDLYLILRQKILSGEIKPGERLPSERTMIEQYKRSRTTVRDALRMLVSEGLIKKIAKSGGAIVIEPSTKTLEQPVSSLISMNQISFDELVEYRMLNETAVAAWAAARRTEDDLQALRDCLALSEDSRNDIEAFLLTDLRYHELLAAAAHNNVANIVNSVVQQIIHKSLLEMSHRDEKPLQEMVELILRMHRALLRAIEKQDPMAAKQAMELHLQDFDAEMLRKDNEHY